MLGNLLSLFSLIMLFPSYAFSKKSVIIQKKNPLFSQSYLPFHSGLLIFMHVFPNPSLDNYLFIYFFILV